MNTRPQRTWQQAVALSGLRWLLLAVVIAALVLIAVSQAGCSTVRQEIDPAKAFTVFPAGVSGVSNDPVRFPSPLVALRAPFPLPVGTFVVRRDRYLMRDQYVIHQIVAVLPDGSYLMQGFNRKTNPVPDRQPLTAANYVGVSYPLPESIP